jgi:hypothetical protein
MSRSTTLLEGATLTLLGLVASSCLLLPDGADRVLGTISAEDPTTHLHAIDITTGSVFKVDVWTHNIPEPGIVDHHFTIVLDYDHEFYLSPEDGRINQHPGSRANGAAYGVDEVATLSPWLAAVGLAGCIAVVTVTVRNRRSRRRRHGLAEEA